ncbi:hypothetical protein J1N35_005059 [Gossypium stocksii]|uniref:DUF4283 domain-containing protein n=1 Tax=Gossypium stocksii TaxID=47602 RepID=A0A9D3WD34_9ROSI|nr:hypothetical protein J1N35_005059 [Gossypium stocksii]
MRPDDPLDSNDPIVDDLGRTVPPGGTPLLHGKTSYLDREISLFLLKLRRISIYRMMMLCRGRLMGYLQLRSLTFLVRFQNEHEYIAIVSGGTWTIFGHYLMVRPWTRGFSTDPAHPNNLLVWVRLPGLSKGMYTKSLLKFIGGVIGPVAKIDQNTDTRSREQFA